MSGAAPDSWRRIGFVTLMFVAAPVVYLFGQSLTVTAVGDSVRVKAPMFRFIEGRTLDRLKGGRSVRVDFELTALAMPGGPAVAESRQGFNLSYDLWEERIAVSRIGAPPRSVSHLTPKDAETWCLDNLTLPAAAVGRSGRTTPFWIRLESRIEDRDPDPAANGEQATLTLGKLIDILSRRREERALTQSLQAGPFRLSN